MILGFITAIPELCPSYKVRDFIILTSSSSIRWTFTMHTCLFIYSLLVTKWKYRSRNFVFWFNRLVLDFNRKSYIISNYYGNFKKPVRLFLLSKKNVTVVCLFNYFFFVIGHNMSIKLYCTMLYVLQYSCFVCCLKIVVFRSTDVDSATWNVDRLYTELERHQRQLNHHREHITAI